MSNINQSLVGKVKAGKAAIEHTLKPEDLGKIRELLGTMFPKDDTSLCLGNMKYYYAQNEMEWGSDAKIGSDYEIIPLSSFFEENPTPKEKESLNRISELLAELKPLIYGVSHLIDQDCYNPYAPINPVCEQPDNEVEYVEIFHNDKYRFNIASSYGAVCQIDKDGEELQGCYNLIYPDGHKGNAFKDCCRTSTREAYLAQTTPVNGEWKEGDWFVDNDGELYCITEFNGSRVCGNSYNEVGTTVDMDMCHLKTKASQAQIQSHLTRIAEKKYPVGTKFKGMHFGNVGEVTHTPQFVYERGELRLLNCTKDFDEKDIRTTWTVWSNGKCAETIKEVEQKERWRPEREDKYFVIELIGGDIEIREMICTLDDFDFDTFNSGNCFPTEEAATKAAQLIRETLKQL